MRADDEARPDCGRAARESALHDLLAESLERAVVPTDVLGAPLGELGELRGLVDDLGERRVHRDARDEDVVLDGVAEQLRARLHDPREVAGRVDDDVPLASREAVEAAVPIAWDPLELGVEIRPGRASVEERELVSPLECRADDRPPEELRAAEQQEPHESSWMPASSRSTSSAVL